MAYIPYSPEIGCKYTLTGPNGVVATFNDSTDTNYVGAITDLSGLDSAGVRENADSLVQQDGGWHGTFYYDRRPITISGTVYGHADALTRTQKIDRMRQATNALAADAVLSWTNNAAGSVAMYTPVRRQQPLKISGGWNKDFQMLLVSQFAPLFSVAAHASASGTSATVENQGDYPARPIITISGSNTSGVLTNTTTGLKVQMATGYNIASGHSVAIDVLNHTAILDGTTNVSGNINFVASTWPPIVKGNNSFTLTGGGTMVISWHDAWS